MNVIAKEIKNESYMDDLHSVNSVINSLAQQVEKLTEERDGLKAARYAYATEFPLDDEGQPDVGSIHQNIRALKSAAKLALYALISESRTTQSNVTLAKILTAITALRKAGVQ